jgi:protocatechuate 3,4-dioxygenase beta subunit
MPPSQLSRDLGAWSRRSALGMRATGACGALIGGSAGALPRTASCLVTPAETRGPFPADGSNGIDVLGTRGILRSDIRSSFAGLQGTAEGVPLDLTLTLIGAAGACAPLSGWALYLWHNDARGEYSLYGLPRVNYLRGLQQTANDGNVRFRTILPGCYGGRCPHLHFEVFSSAEAAMSGEPALLASQFALPEAPCRAVYSRDPRYGDSLAHLDRWPTVRDFVFRDASPEELALQSIAMKGDASSGLRGTARVSVSA